MNAATMKCALKSTTLSETESSPWPDRSGSRDRSDQAPGPRVVVQSPPLAQMDLRSILVSLSVNMPFHAWIRPQRPQFACRRATVGRPNIARTDPRPYWVPRSAAQRMLPPITGKMVGEKLCARLKIAVRQLALSPSFPTGEEIGLSCAAA